MICAIMQPTYLPWAGYFNLIDQADVFVFLDDAQLQKNSWHNRNRLLVNHKPHWITVPVRRDTLAQSIKETEIDTVQNWRKKHCALLRQTYGKHPYGKEMLDVCSVIEQSNIAHLADLNINLVRWILDNLDIRTEIILASSMGIEGKRTTRLIELLHRLQADTYLSPKGATDYLGGDEFIEQTRISLRFQEFNPAPYPQYQHHPFESHLSIIDVVANIGWEATGRYIL